MSAILDRLGIRHYMGGSFASSIYGEYRTTRDLDVVLQRPERVWRQLVAELRPAFTFIEADVTDALARVNAPDERFVSFAMYERATGYQVDMFLARNGPYERVQFGRILLGAGRDPGCRATGPASSRLSARAVRTPRHLA